MERKINKMTHEKHFQLVEMIRNEREWLMTNLPTFTKAAVYLSEKLGFTVGAPTIPAAVALAGVTWKRHPPKRPTQPNRLAELEGMYQLLLDDNQKLHAKVNHLQGMVNTYLQRNGVSGVVPTNTNRVNVAR